MINGFCTTKLRSATLLAMAAFLLMFIAACGGDDEQCEENETWAVDRGGEAACLLQCEQGEEDACPEGRTCDDRGLCTADADIGDDNQENQENQESDLSAEDKELCDDFCALRLGCLAETCSGLDPNGIATAVAECVGGSPTNPQNPGCYAEMAGPGAEEARETYEMWVYGDFVSGAIGTEKNTCASLKWAACGVEGLYDPRFQCGCEAPTNVGGACETNAECGEGDLLFAECITELQSGTEVPGGMCVAGFCNAVADSTGDRSAPVTVNGGCGDGNGCVAESSDTIIGECRQLCDSASDCREDMACQYAGALYVQDLSSDTLSSPAGQARACNLACSDDDDCGGSARCNVDTGACEFTCDEAAAEDLCGELNGECLPFDEDGNPIQVDECTEATVLDDCGDGHICVDGSCEEDDGPSACTEATVTDDCAAGEICVDDVCTEDPDAVACTEATVATDCAAGEICVDEFCAEDPDAVPCTEATVLDDCGAGMICVDDFCAEDDGPSACTEATVTDDCAAGEICVDDVCTEDPNAVPCTEATVTDDCGGGMLCVDDFCAADPDAVPCTEATVLDDCGAEMICVDDFCAEDDGTDPGAGNRHASRDLEDATFYCVLP